MVPERPWTATTIQNLVVLHLYHKITHQWKGHFFFIKKVQQLLSRPHYQDFFVSTTPIEATQATFDHIDHASWPHKGSQTHFKTRSYNLRLFFVSTTAIEATPATFDHDSSRRKRPQPHFKTLSNNLKVYPCFFAI